MSTLEQAIHNARAAPKARVGTILCAVGIAALTITAYFPTRHCGFVWDDDRYVTNNAADFADNLRKLWLEPGATDQYYPLTYTTFWLEYKLWGLNAFGYHFANVMLHCTNALLIWRILSKLGVPGAWLAGAIFAVHPVHVESVAWITERKNTLSLAFYLLAALAYIRFERLDDAAPTQPRRTWAYVFILVFFTLSLSAKTSTVTFPAAMLVVHWWKRGRVGVRSLLALAPLFALAVGAGLMTAWMEKHNVGTQTIEWRMSAVDRVCQAGRAIWFYVGKLLWPVNLAFFYPRWTLSGGVARFVHPLLVVAAVAALWRSRSSLGRGPLAGFLLFVGGLFPTLGFIDVYVMRYSFAADHFQYLPSVSLIALAAAGLAGARARAGTGSRNASVLAVDASAVVVLGALSVCTWRQCAAYENEEALWMDTIKKNPSAWMAHNNLGRLLERKGQLEPAGRQYREALLLNPDLFEAHYNYATLLLRRGALAEAEKHFLEAIRLKPDMGSAHYNYGVLLAKQKKNAEATKQFREVLRYEPGDATAHFRLAMVLTEAGRHGEAFEHYRRALRIKPDHVGAQLGLARSLDQLGRPKEAEEAYQRVLQLDPGNEAARKRAAAFAGSMPATQPGS